MRLRKDDPVYYKAELIKLLKAAEKNGVEVRSSETPFDEEIVIWFSNNTGEHTAVLIKKGE
ncbi:hypothetical protein [Clostridium sp.]|uniref:hypothetical protein n=1 Tax=Clostridium sp. TaxID=1506 RepID=UPI0039940ADE